MSNPISTHDWNLHCQKQQNNHDNHDISIKSSDPTTTSVPSTLIAINKMIRQQERYGLTIQNVNSLSYAYVTRNFGVQPTLYTYTSLTLPFQERLCCLINYPTNLSLPQDLHQVLINLNCITPSKLFNTFGGGMRKFAQMMAYENPATILRKYFHEFSVLFAFSCDIALGGTLTQKGYKAIA